MDTPVSVVEQPIWRGSPSQWINFGAFLGLGIIALVLIAAIIALSSAGPAALGGFQSPGLIALWIALAVVLAVIVKRYLDVRFWIYEVSTDRVRVTRGILSKRTDGLELYRVDDILLLQPFLLRLIGKGNIQLVTSDRTHPNMLIEAVPQTRWLWDELRVAVEACRDRKRTRVIDFTEDDDQ